MHEDRQARGDGVGHDLEFQRLLDKLPAAAYTCDPAGLITYFNGRAIELWGRCPALLDARDRYCGSFKLRSLDGAPLEHDQCPMALAIRNNEEFNGREVVIERPTGECVPVLVHANPIRGEGGALLGAVNVLIDISEQRRAAQALVELERSRNELLAMLSHELRNPLAPIRTAVQILQLGGSASPEGVVALEVIERQVQQMTRLISDLLDLARTSAGKLELHRAPLELGSVLHAALETSRPLIDAGGQELIVELSAEPLIVEGDLTRLSQVVSNLLNNAAKYSDPGTQIHLSLQRGEPGEALLRVRDQGIGIEEDVLPHVFDLFRQGEAVVGRSNGGLGIGLTLVQRVTELHGGSVHVHSDGPGRGAEVLVRLPLARDLASADAPGSAEDERPAQPDALRILVVDDNRDAADCLGTLLRLQGHHPRIARSGGEGLAVAEEFRPAVLLLDVGLPGMDGWQLAREIRSRPWGAKSLLIALSGLGQESDRRLSREAGFDHHLVKPVEPEALRELLAAARPAALY